MVTSWNQYRIYWILDKSRIMNGDLIIRAKDRNIREQVADRTIKLMIGIIQSEPWSINFVVPFKVNIGPIELKGAN